MPAAGANDGGGSIRIPAGCNGLVGLKPSRGLTPYGPQTGEPMFGMAVHGVVARTVRDNAALMDAIIEYASTPEGMLIVVGVAFIGIVLLLTALIFWIGSLLRRRGVKVAVDGEVGWLRPPLVFQVSDRPLYLLKPQAAAAAEPDGDSGAVA